MLTRLKQTIDNQRGQVVVMAVGFLVLGLAAIMISVDVGYWLRDKRDAQNDADAIALAASQHLPDIADAILVGEEEAIANDVDPLTELGQPTCPGSDLPAGNDWLLQDNFCFEDHGGNGDMDRVRVRVSRPSGSFVSAAFGVAPPTLNPQAAAGTVYVKGACVMPWGIVGEDDHREHLYHLDASQLYVFQGSGDFAEDSSGNFGAISIYGEGADTYDAAIKGDCTPANNACTSDPMVFIGETLAGCSSEPGTKGAVTAKALNERYPDAPSPGVCDAATLAEAEARLDDPDCQDRLVPVAIINNFPPQGSSADVNIYGIVNFYLAGWNQTKTCFTFPDGSERCGFVWGYLMPNAPVSTALAAFTEDFIPFAPTGNALVE